MKKFLCIIVGFFCLSSIHAQPQVSYRNPNLSVKERIQNLLSLMTLEEKVGQLLCPLGWEMYDKQGTKVTQSKRFEQLVKERNVGMLWAVYRADPWTKKTLENGLTPELAAKVGNALQHYMIEKTRLGIPLFLAEESPHGHMAIGTTVFPTGIGLASTWSKSLLKEVGTVISKEIRMQGAHIAYGPVLDLSRDPRWSRVEETYGEDPVLSGQLGAAIITGEGGGNIAQKFSVISTLKHFLAYGVAEGGLNGNASSVGIHDLTQTFLPPFKAAVDAGALSVMTSYNSVDGIPCTSNKYLLTDILQNTWKFHGFSVSDLYSIEGIKNSHFVAATIEDAAVQAISAGTNVDLGGDAYFKLIEAAKSGKVLEAIIDSAVYRVLRLKFEMGLFENPYVNPKDAKTGVRSASNIAVARKAAQESVVLLKNNGVLPLSNQIHKLAVIGPNANNRYNMLGDYTAPQEDSNVKTVLDGIHTKLPSASVEYVKGCDIRDTTQAEIDKAVTVAKASDVVVVVVGGSSARDFKTSYIATGAAVASKDNVSDMECGEGFDRASLDLLGKQMDLLKALQATGKPLIVVYIQGRPLNMNWAAEHAEALLTAWYPGQEGGDAIADVLFGDYNPAGRLPISIPRSVGQLPVYYNKANPVGHTYVEMPSTPLYSFGYGLSFSQFQYGDLKVEKSGNNAFDISFSVTNTGKFDGDEVAQLYLRDEVASTVQPNKQLKHFERLFLKKGEQKIVKFILTPNDLSVVNPEFKTIVEPGAFKVMVGASSDDIRLNTTLVIP